MKRTTLTAVFSVLLSLIFIGCSEQSQSPDSALPAGDVRIEFGLQNSVVTYASADDEVALKTLQVWLSYKSSQAGAEKLIKFDAASVVVKDNSASVSFTLKGSEYIPGPGKLYLIGNAADPNLTFANAAELDAAVDSKAIYTISNKILSLHDSGMTVTRKLNLNLLSGMVVSSGTYADDTNPATNKVTAGNLKLRRLAARIYVVAEPADADISNYTVSFDNAALNSQAGYFTYAGREAGKLPGVAAYVTGSESSAGQYNGQEAVGYVYPSSAEAKVTVTNPLGVPRAVAFVPQSNNNYKITIKPTGASDIGFTVTINGYNEQGNDLDADFQ